MRHMAPNAQNKPTSRPRKVLKRLALLVVVLLVAAVGYFVVRRYWMGNFHTVVEGQVYRSAQPSPRNLKDWVARYGLKTVINLRGENDKPFYETERKALDAVGVKMIDIRFSAGRLPSAPSVKQLIAALEQADRPILLHCRDGIDRTGMASVIAAMAIGGQDYTAAHGQLSWRYLGRGAATGGVAELFTEYEAHCTRQGVETGRWPQFRQWATSVYHPYYYFVEIVVPRTVRARPGRIVEVPVTITNRSSRTIPAGRADWSFEVMAFWGPREGPWPTPPQLGCTFLPKRDIPPGGSVKVIHQFLAPRQPERRLFHVDVYARDARQTLFGREGSPTPTCELIIEADAASQPVRDQGQ